MQKQVEQGRRSFASLKSAIWKPLCDPQSEIYNVWNTNGVAHVLSKKYYAIVVSAALIDSLSKKNFVAAESHIGETPGLAKIERCAFRY
jgi:hypothetical protein